MADNFVIGRYGDKLSGAQAAMAAEGARSIALYNFVQVWWSNKIREVLK
jgi:hypothetical protein